MQACHCTRSTKIPGCKQRDLGLLLPLASYHQEYHVVQDRKLEETYQSNYLKCKAFISPILLIPSAFMQRKVYQEKPFGVFQMVLGR